MTTAQVSVAVVALGVVGAGVFAWQYRAAETVVAPNASATYLCDAGATITARFYEGTPSAPLGDGVPPTPEGRVELALSDQRTYTLAQTLSADGGRYATSDESFVFWDKGASALVLEQGEPRTYTHCIAVSPLSEGLTQVYHTDRFTIRVPDTYRIDTLYEYQNLAPGTTIPGVAFRISTSTHQGTNLSGDSYVSVESLDTNAACSADLFLDQRAVGAERAVREMATSSDAAAGNRYDETVYAMLGTSPCIAVRYFIHSTVFENYPPGTVRAFDRAALLARFDAIRLSLVLVP